MCLLSNEYLQLTSHYICYSVCNLFPKVEIVFAGVKNGCFLIDLYCGNNQLSEKEFSHIEQYALQAIKEKKFSIHEMTRSNALSLMIKLNQNMRVEELESLDRELIHMIKIGEFFDLTSEDLKNDAKCFKELKIVFHSRYQMWHPKKGTIEVLRLMGLSHDSKKELKSLVRTIKEKNESCHLEDMQKKDLISISSEIDGACPIWKEKGIKLKHHIFSAWMKALKEEENQHIIKTADLAPAFSSKKKKEIDLIWDQRVWTHDWTKTYHHLVYYQTIDPALKNDLVKVSEMADCMRNLSLQDVNGLYKSRIYTKDFTHIFCKSRQVDKALISSLQFIQKNVNILPNMPKWRLISNRQRPLTEKRRTSKRNLQLLRDALDGCQISYEEVKAYLGRDTEAKVAFYYTDQYGKNWQGGGLSILRKQPKWFDRGLYTGIDYLICRSLFGSVERLIACVAEQNGGKLPLVMMPYQGLIVTAGQNSIQYANAVLALGAKKGIRLNIDSRSVSLSQKIKEAEENAEAFIAVVGDKEEALNMIAMRDKKKGQISLTPDVFFDLIIKKQQNEWIPQFMRSKQE